MVIKAWAVIQAALEYGATAAGRSGLPMPDGVRTIVTWVSDHGLVVFLAVAVLLLLGLSSSGRRI